jgi:hypothetical protein
VLVSPALSNVVELLRLQLQDALGL